MLTRLAVTRQAATVSTEQLDKVARFLRNKTKYAITLSDAPGELIVRDRLNTAIVAFTTTSNVLMYQSGRPGPTATDKPGMTPPAAADKILYNVMDALTDYGG